MDRMQCVIDSWWHQHSPSASQWKRALYQWKVWTVYPKSTSHGEKKCAIIGFIEDTRSRSGLMPHPQQVGKDPKPRPTVVQVFIPPKRARLSNTCLWIWIWDMAGIWDPEKGSVAILRVWGEKKAEGEKEREACRWLELENGVQAGKGHGAYQVIACFAFECSHGVLHVIIIIIIIIFIIFTYFSCWIASLAKDIELFGSNGALMIPRRAFIRPLQESNGAWVKAVVNGAWCSCYNMSATFHFWNWECEIKNQNDACGCIIIRSSGGSTSSSTWPNASSERIISYVVDTLQFRGWSYGWTISIGGNFYSLIIICSGHLIMMNLCTWYASQGAAVRCAICSGRATRGIYNWCVVVDRKSCWGVSAMDDGCVREMQETSKTSKNS